MVRFAQSCLFKFVQVTKRLEVTLGPDTGELRLRKYGGMYYAQYISNPSKLMFLSASQGLVYTLDPALQVYCVVTVLAFSCLAIPSTLPHVWR